MRRIVSAIVHCSIAALLLASSATALEAATLKVSSFPSGARVIVDGVDTGKVTPINISLTEGDHVVTVQIPNSGWNPDTRTITIVSGNNDLSVTLLPILTVGPPGPKGDKGDTGATGAAGADGMDATATRADGPCFDTSNRYVDCGNGTVTDTVTGLIWLKQWNCLPDNKWAFGNQAAAGLKNGDCGLTDNSSAGDWRLATKDEWTATIAHAVALGCTGAAGPALTNDAGRACFSTGPSSFAGVASEFFWSSSSVETNPGTAWMVSLDNGDASGSAKISAAITHAVWPVRSGSR